MSDRRPITIRFDEVRAWLFDAALPFWSKTGVDRVHGGFVEQLDLDARDGGAAFKRTRAQCRQVYCFTHAALLGWSEGAALADHGWAFLQAHGRRADGAWVRRMGRDGGVIDATCDAYDMAFVLFAHAWRFRLTGESAVIDSALETVAALDAVLKHPNGLGWLTEEGATGPREQNPHMHIIEAALELAEATGHPRFRALLDEVLTLFQTRFFDREHGVQREFYAADWSRLEGPRGEIVEPGHMFEWAWILYRAQRLLGVETSADALRLHEVASRIGVVAPSGLTIDQVKPDGTVISGASRLWPQTEALKANLAVLEMGGLDTRRQIAECVDNLLDRYLATTPRGVWIDQFDADGNPDVDKIPPTSFYHLFLAMSELLRLQPTIEAMAA